MTDSALLSRQVLLEFNGVSMHISGFSAANGSHPQRYHELAAQAGPENVAGTKLSAQTGDSRQQRETQALKDRDREVRAHEQAHLSSAGGIAVSGARFQFVIGPDGQRYATGGEVSIDTSAVPNDPLATLRKAETIRRAALAPAQPSGQDYSVAAKAAMMARRAGIELLKSTEDKENTGLQLNVSA